MAKSGTLSIRIVGDDSHFGKTLDQTENKLSGFASKLPGVLGVAGGVAGAALAAGLFEALDRDASNDKLAAALNLDEKDSKAAGRIAGEVWADAFGDEIGEVNTAVEGVLSTLGTFADLGEDGVDRLARKALTVADVFDTDVSEAISAAGVLLSSGLVNDADEAFDTITRGMQQMPAALRGELLEASTEYSQFFDALGFDAAEAFGILVKGAEDGIYGIDKAGDAIKEFTIRSTDMSTATVDAFNAIGLDAETMASRILHGGEVAKGAFDEIVTGVLAIEDPVLRANTAIALMGTPLEDLSVNDIPEFLESLLSMESGLDDVKGATDRVADAAYDNLRTKWTETWRGAQQSFLTFADENILPAVDRILAAFDEDGLSGAIAQVGEEWNRAWPVIDEWLTGTVQPAVVDFGVEAGQALADALWEATKEGVKNKFRQLPGMIGEFLTPPGIQFHNQQSGGGGGGGGARTGSRTGGGGGGGGRALVFHDGTDRVPGYPGQEVPALLEAGERVVPADVNLGRRPTVQEPDAGQRAGNTFVVSLHGGDRQLAEDAMIELKKLAIAATY